MIMMNQVRVAIKDKEAFPEEVILSIGAKRFCQLSSPGEK